MIGILLVVIWSGSAAARRQQAPIDAAALGPLATVLASHDLQVVAAGRFSSFILVVCMWQ